MSVLNLGLQCVGLARAKMTDEFEKEVAKYNTISEIRKNLEEKSSVVDDSLSPVKVLLCKVFSRLKLHDNQFKMFTSATNDEISKFWSAIVALDATLTERGIY